MIIYHSEHGLWPGPQSIIVADRLLTANARYRATSQSLVTRTRNVIRNEVRYATTTYMLAYGISRYTEAEVKRWPNVGIKTLALIKAWLAIHRRELTND